MAKTIKFNLICDGYPVRTIEDLREHFSIEDILNYYNNGLLLRWLEVRGYEIERDKVKSIDTTENIGIIKELVKIFEVETDDEIIRYDTYILGYKQIQEQQSKLYAENKIKKDQIINDYFLGYQSLVERILNNSKDMAVIKAAINEIQSNYKLAFDSDYRALFNTFRNHAPKAIYAMLMNSYMREFFLSPIGDLSIDVAEDEVEDEVKITDSYSGLYNVIKAVARKNELPSLHSQQVLIEINNQRGALEVDRKAMYMFIKKTLLDPGFMREHLGADLKSCFDKTAPYAKTLEDKGKFMVLSMGSNDRVGAFNDHINEYTFADIDGKFCILDGLTYNSDSYSALYYLEV